MINLKIDPEFQSQIPPLTDDEFKQLEENILKEGKLISPLIVWGNTLVDGHNRYAILQKHPEIYFSTMPLPFESREEVLAWICKNQLGRRNLTPEQKYYLMGKQYEAEKAAHGGDRKSSDAKSSSLKANLIDNSKTCDRIAEENGVSKDTVIRASKYMKGVEIAEELMPGLKQSILSGQTKVSKADMHRLAKAAYYDRAQILQDILHPELKVEPTPDADGVIRVPGKAPVMPFRKFESVYDSDAYPEDVRYEYVALEELTTRFRISFNYQLEQMPDNAQRDVILEIINIPAIRILWNWANKATIQASCWMAQWKSFCMMKMAIRSASAGWQVGRFSGPNWPVPAGVPVRSACGPTQTVRCSGWISVRSCPSRP